MNDCVTSDLSEFGRAVIDGLRRPRKAIPARYFYDQRGSELFEEITRLPEYYPTRTETALLRNHGDDLARLIGQGATIVEFGAGSATKTPLLLDATRAQAYVAIDISADFLDQSLAELQSTRPALKVTALAGDFTQSLSLPPLSHPLVGFFSGSTIGNFDHRGAVDLLRSFRETLGDDAMLVIGIDTRKNPRLLEAAYDDSAGVTAAFNLNLLDRINRELDGDVPVDSFDHHVVWHDGLGRIEMHLEAKRDVTFGIAGQRFSMASGETIHTENSYKYSFEEARFLARASGWAPLATWTDSDAMFGLHVWTADGAEAAL